MLALAVDADRPLGPVDVLEIDSQCFLTAQTTVVDQPEQCAIARSADGAERGLDLCFDSGALSGRATWALDEIAR